jgi:RHS repeat-associated protein
MTNKIHISNYSPFRVLLQNRNFTGEKYRYGFQRQEKDDEWSGANNSYDFGARIYDPRLGRWLSVDPKFREDPEFSPYCFAYYSPLLFHDPDGKKPKVTILPQSFAHQVGQPITSIYQLGQTTWSPTKFTIDKNGKITGIEINITSVLNYAFVEPPMAVNNPNSKLNKENPGLYTAVSTHESIHANHIKAILEDDTQIYTFGNYQGNINDIYASFYNDLVAEKKAAYAKISETTYKTEAEKNAAYKKVDVDIQNKQNQFEKSIQTQVMTKLNQKYKAQGGEEQATIKETIQKLKAAGETEAVKYQQGKAAKVNGKEVK